MESQKPSKLVEAAYFLVVKITRLIGVNMPVHTLVSERLLFCIFIQLNVAIMIINGLVHMEGSFEKFCHMTIFLSLYTQIMFREYNRFFNDDEAMTNNLLKKVIAFYERYEEKHGKILLVRAQLTHRLLRAFTYLYFLIYLIPVIICWILFFVAGIHATVVPFSYPFTSIDTLPGYLFNMVLTTFCALILIVVMICAHYVMFFFGVQSIPMVDILSIKLWQLRVKIEANKKLISEMPRPDVSMIFREQMRLEGIIDNAIWDMHRKAHEELLEIISFINDYNAYVEEFLSAIRLIAFADVTFNAITLGLAVIYMLTYSIPIGIGLIIIYFFDILTPCIIGTIIAHQNDRISDEVWSFPWYELSISDQKIFLQLIHLCQNLNDLELPMIGFVDMELLQNIIFGAYSYFTYILNFVKI